VVNKSAVGVGGWFQEWVLGEELALPQGTDWNRIASWLRRVNLLAEVVRAA
jgi:hypothetical protein